MNKKNNCSDSLERRLIWADSLKGILILLVVFGHSFLGANPILAENTHLYNIIYSFHMPAFMALSGYLNYRGGVSNRLSVVKRRCKQLLVPFYAWVLIKILIGLPQSLHSWYNNFMFPDSSFWFLWTLFFISAIFYFTDWLSFKIHISQELAIVLIGLLLVLLMVIFDIRILGFQFIAYYFLFFSLGYYLNKYQDTVLIGKSWILFGLTLIWFFLAWFWKHHELPSFMQNLPNLYSVCQYTYRFVTATIACYVIFCFCPRHLNTLNNCLNRFLVWIGNFSLGIYTSHSLIMKPVSDIFRGLELNYPLTILLIFMVSLFLSILSIILIRKNVIAQKLLLGK